MLTAQSGFDRTNLELLKIIPADAKVILEFNCGAGNLAAQYKLINPHCHYIGIISQPELVKSAALHIDRIIINSLDKLDINQLKIADESVDCIIFGDLLPQLDNPLEILRKYTKLLRPDGQILAIIPNLQYWHNIVNLLRGNGAELSEKRPHLFTIETIKSLFHQAGLQIYELQTGGQVSSEFPKFQEIMAPIVNALGINYQQFGQQTSAEYFIVRSTKLTTPPRRLLIQTAIMAPTGCDRLRVLEPDSLSATIPGVRTFSMVKTLQGINPIPGEEKVFIWQRTIMSYDYYIPKLKQLLQADYLIVAEIDDNPIRRREYADNKYLSYRGCHCVQTSTEPLGAFLRQINPNVAVFRNQLAYLPPERDYNKGNKITIFFGALNREKDWEPIMPALNEIIAKNGEKLHFKIVHDQLFFDSIKTNNKEYEPFCSYERYQEILHTCDLALLPLNPNPVNEMKSDLKFLECAGHGVTVMASPTVYADSIIDGETGIIYHSPKEFQTKLQELINDQEKRQKIAQNAYNWVRDYRLLSQHFYQRYDWYLQMRDALPRLNAELRERVPELFD